MSDRTDELVQNTKPVPIDQGTGFVRYWTFSVKYVLFVAEADICVGLCGGSTVVSSGVRRCLVLSHANLRGTERTNKTISLPRSGTNLSVGVALGQHH